MRLQGFGWWGGQGSSRDSRAVRAGGWVDQGVVAAPQRAVQTLRVLPVWAFVLLWLMGGGQVGSGGDAWPWPCRLAGGRGGIPLMT